MEKKYSPKNFEKKINILKNKFLELFNIQNFELIFDFLDWFKEKLDLNFNKKNPDLKLNKWEIYFINLWKNIWSELNKKRPCIIFSDWFFNNWNTVSVIPLKSYEWKKYNRSINIFIEKNHFNWLKENSIADLSWIRQISKKRIWLFIWNLENENILKINKKIMKFFWIKKQTVN